MVSTSADSHHTAKKKSTVCHFTVVRKIVGSSATRAMIEAERTALQWEAFHSSLNILEREMGVILQYMTNVGTQAALLGGFAFSLIAGVEQSPVFEAFYLALAVLSFGLFMYTIICSTLSASLGPTKAYKGKEASAMRAAIESMKSDRRKITFAYNLGVLLFMLLVILQVYVITGAPAPCVGHVHSTTQYCAHPHAPSQSVCSHASVSVSVFGICVCVCVWCVCGAYFALPPPSVRVPGSDGWVAFGIAVGVLACVMFYMAKSVREIYNQYSIDEQTVDKSRVVSGSAFLAMQSTTVLNAGEAATTSSTEGGRT
jgi:hypothetical protein